MLKPLLLLSQRDSKWANILLGFNTNLPYTLGNFGCLITCLSMYIGKLVNETNDILKANQAFAKDSGEFIWGKSSALGLNQTYLSPRYTDAVTAQGFQKIKELIDAGFPLLCEVDFNPNTSGEEMHFVLIIGYKDDNFYAADPWVGEIINLSVYGGAARAIIQFRAYDKTLSTDVAPTNGDDDFKRGMQVLTDYRNQRAEGKEGNFEGYTRVLIERDARWLQVQTDLINAQKAADNAIKDQKEISVQADGLSAAVKEYQKGIDTLWQMLNPLGGDKNMATIISEVQQLLSKEQNLTDADKNALKSQQKYIDLLAKLKLVVNSSSDDEVTILGVLESLLSQKVENGVVTVPIAKSNGRQWWSFLLFWR